MLKAGGGGSLINVANLYGVVGTDHRNYDHQPSQCFPAYSAFKAGIIGLTRWLATWWGKDGIRVNYVSPGGGMIIMNAFLQRMAIAHQWVEWQTKMKSQVFLYIFLVTRHVIALGRT